MLMDVPVQLRQLWGLQQQLLQHHCLSSTLPEVPSYEAAKHSGNRFKSTADDDKEQQLWPRANRQPKAVAIWQVHNT
jgi:hypothetical protein